MVENELYLVPIDNNGNIDLTDISIHKTEFSNVKELNQFFYKLNPENNEQIYSDTGELFRALSVEARTQLKQCLEGEMDDISLIDVHYTHQYRQRYVLMTYAKIIN